MLFLYLRMEKKKKSKLGNILFVLVIALLIIPQTRKPIQIVLNKGLALFGPSVIDEEKRDKLTNYNWDLLSEDNQPFDFNQVKGKVVVINFWATWCPPCIAEMESLEKLYKKFSDEDDVVFLFVTTDFFSEISKFKEKHNYTFPAYRQLNQEHPFFNVPTIPRTFIIDKEGNVAVDKDGASNWYSETVVDLIENLLKK